MTRKQREALDQAEVEEQIRKLNEECDSFGICKVKARFPVNEPPYCGCLPGVCDREEL